MHLKARQGLAHGAGPLQPGGAVDAGHGAALGAPPVLHQHRSPPINHPPLDLGGNGRGAVEHPPQGMGAEAFPTGFRQLESPESATATGCPPCLCGLSRRREWAGKNFRRASGSWRARTNMVGTQWLWQTPARSIQSRAAAASNCLMTSMGAPLTQSYRAYSRGAAW